MFQLHANCFLASIRLTVPLCADSSHAVSVVQLPAKTNVLFFQKLVVGWIPIVLQRWGIVLQTVEPSGWVCRPLQWRTSKQHSFWSSSGLILQQSEGSSLSGSKPRLRDFWVVAFNPQRSLEVVWRTRWYGPPLHELLSRCKTFIPNHSSETGV